MKFLTLSSENWLYYERELSNYTWNGLHYIFKFGNNYGASVIKGQYTYGGDSDLWEMALIKFKDNGNTIFATVDYDLVYEEDFETDVIGWLSDEEVDKYLSLIRLYSEECDKDKRIELYVGFAKEVTGKDFSVKIYDTTIGKALIALRALQKEFPDYYFDPKGSPQYGYSIGVFKKGTTPLYTVQPGVYGKWTKIN